MTWLLGLVTRPWVAYAAVAGAMLLATSWGALGWDHAVTIPGLERDVASAREETKNEKAGRLADRTLAAEAAARQAEAFKRQQESMQKRVDRAQENADAKNDQLDRAVVAGGAVADLLRARIAALAAAARRGTQAASAAGGGEATSDPAGVLADVCRSADERAGVLARYADRLRISGEACVSAWPVNPPKDDQGG